MKENHLFLKKELNKIALYLVDLNGDNPGS